MASATVEAVIRADEAYGIGTFRKITGMGDAALRAARKAGLPVRKVGTRSYIVGADWLDYLKRQPSRVDN